VDGGALEVIREVNSETICPALDNSREFASDFLAICNFILYMVISVMSAEIFDAKLLSEKESTKYVKDGFMYLSVSSKAPEIMEAACSHAQFYSREPTAVLIRAARKEASLAQWAMKVCSELCEDAKDWASLVSEPSLAAAKVARGGKRNSAKEGVSNTLVAATSGAASSTLAVEHGTPSVPGFNSNVSRSVPASACGAGSALFDSNSSSPAPMLTASAPAPARVLVAAPALVGSAPAAAVVAEASDQEVVDVDTDEEEGDSDIAYRFLYEATDGESELDDSILASMANYKDEMPLIRGPSAAGLYSVEVPVDSCLAGRVIGAGGAVRMQLETETRCHMQYRRGLMSVRGYKQGHVYRGVVALCAMRDRLPGWSSAPGIISYQPVASFDDIISAKHDMEQMYDVRMLLRKKSMKVEILGDSIHGVEAAAADALSRGINPIIRDERRQQGYSTRRAKRRAIIQDSSAAKARAAPLDTVVKKSIPHADGPRWRKAMALRAEEKMRNQLLSRARRGAKPRESLTTEAPLEQ
jgi:hypothetical protein